MMMVMVMMMLSQTNMMRTCGDRVLALRSRGGGMGLILFARDGSPGLLSLFFGSPGLLSLFFGSPGYDHIITDKLTMIMIMKMAMTMIMIMAMIRTNHFSENQATRSRTT